MAFNLQSLAEAFPQTSGQSSSTVKYVLIDEEESLRQAVRELSKYGKIAFDAEGVNLGRTGDLTVAIFSGINNSNSALI